jgi:TonB family protein
VTKSLDPGLDKEAIKAVKLWRFEPGTKDGKPVRVQISLELTFTLRDPPAQPLINAGPPATGKVADAGQANGVPIYKPGNGVTPPRLLKDVKPQYTREAKDAKIQGIVYLDGVVETDGSVGDVVVTRSLDAGLDEEAIKAVKQWKYEPGTKDGKPVRVQVSFEMTFTPR